MSWATDSGLDGFWGTVVSHVHDVVDMVAHCAEQIKKPRSDIYEQENHEVYDEDNIPTICFRLSPSPSAWFHCA